MLEGLHKSESGLIRALVSLDSTGEQLQEVMLAGDYILTPEKYIDEMEGALKGVKAKEENIKEALDEFYQEKKGKFQSPKTGPADFTKAIAKALEKK